MRGLWLVMLCWVALTAQADEALWKKLQTEENIVVLARHTQVSGGDGRVWDETGQCRGEMMLSNKGKNFARQLGAEFEKRGIKPLVISSPMCRCKDTATLMFGGVGATDPVLREIATAEGAQVEAFHAKVRALLSQHRGKTPIAFVSHRPNIDALTLELVEFGHLIVGKVSDTGEVDVIGTIKIEP